MTNQEILHKAIEKAVAGGYPYIYEDPEHELDIFNHDFAKALWGTEEIATVIDDEGCDTAGYLWESHLQSMVIAPDPIAYLGEHLDD